jgi:hypothetical protein
VGQGELEHVVLTVCNVFHNTFPLRRFVSPAYSTAIFTHR